MIMRYDFLRATMMGVLGLIVLLGAGCGTSANRELEIDRAAMDAKARFPFFLDGPMSLLLTNATGFEAQLTAETVQNQGETTRLFGRLFGQNGKFLFALEVRQIQDERKPVKGVSYLWDTATGRGAMLSDPLQGYAPVEATLRYTFTTNQAASGATASERIDGHVCDVTDWTALASDGSRSVLRVWRASDLQGWPLRLRLQDTNATLTVNLEHVSFAFQPVDIFTTTNGFTRYSTPAAMLDELASRQHQQRHKSLPPLGDPEDIGGVEGRKSRPGHQ